MKRFNRDTAWLALLIVLACTAAVVAIIGFKKRLQSEVAIFQNNSEIRIGVARLPTALDLDNLTSIEDYEVLSRIHRSLVQLDQAGRIYPGVAKNWTVLDEGKQIVFQLRPNLTFASGRPFSCGDVLETLEHLKDSRDASLFGVTIIKNMQCKSDFQFVVTLERPSPFFLIELANLRYSIRPAESFSQTSHRDLDGLGPYRIVNFNPSSRYIRLLRRSESPYVTAQAPLKIRYEKIDEFDSAIQKAKAGEIDLYPLHGQLMESGSLLAASQHIDRVWMLILSKKMMQERPHLTRCLNTQIKRENIVASMKDPGFFKTGTVVSVDDENNSQSRLLLSGLEADEKNCAHVIPRNARIIMTSNYDPRLVEAISHELRRVGVKYQTLSSYSKEEINQKLAGDSYDIAIFSYGTDVSAASDLAYYFIRNPSFPPSQWVDQTLSNLVKRITVSRNESEAHERIFNVLGASLRRAPLIALFFEKERYLAGKCIHTLDPDRLFINQQLASLVRDEGCR